MPRFCANLTMLYTERDFLDRFAAARADGFEAVEYMFPYAHPKERLAEALARHGLRQILHNLPAGTWEAGERGIACHPERVSEFREGVDEAIRYARALGVKQVNCLAGIVPHGVHREAAHETIVSNLTFAAAKLKEAGIRLLIEPVNTFDIPGFFLSRTAQALALIKETGSDNLFLQYDIYHMQRMEGELFRTIEANLPSIRHIQLADNPGRFEPGTGEINYRVVLAQLDAMGYDGWVGCEYKPKAGTVEGLGWRAAHGV